MRFAKFPHVCLMLTFGLAAPFFASDALAARTVTVSARRGYSGAAPGGCTLGTNCSVAQTNGCFYHKYGEQVGSVRPTESCSNPSPWILTIPVETTVTGKTMVVDVRTSDLAPSSFTWASYNQDGTYYAGGSLSPPSSLSVPASGYLLVAVNATWNVSSSTRIINYTYQYDCSGGSAC